jgi:hypothetical protein
MAIQPGTHVGPYEILTAIGAGGMGEVCSLDHSSSKGEESNEQSSCSSLEKASTKKDR